jgi:geranylgeranyl diphosphate synthase type II
MYTSNEILQKVNDFIAALPFSRKPASLYEPIRYALSAGGKRIRPTLMLLTYNMYKPEPADILQTAVGLETYHNYTLLHDDLMDNADLRRGRETVHRRWDANTAILSGDSMLVMAYEMMEKCGDKHLRQIMQLFTETALEIGEGQQYDMDFELRQDVREEEYIEMIRLKTSVLLACATKMGAILADASAEDADNLYRFGEQMGLAFQLQDDYLDVYGDTKVFGKAIGGDIISNKKTFMLINAINHANAEQRAELMHWISAKDFNEAEKIAAVTKLYNEIGIDRMAQEKINYYFAESRKCLDAVSLPREKKEQLLAFTDKMMHRNK